MLNVLWTTANDFKWTHSTREYTMLAAFMQLAWQQPSNQGDLGLSVVGESERVFHIVDLLLVSFLYCTTWLLLGCTFSGIFCITRSWGSSVSIVTAYRLNDWGSISRQRHRILPLTCVSRKDNHEKIFGMEQSPVFRFCCFWQSLWFCQKEKNMVEIETDGSTR
jgi:hypothetical protein